MPQQADLQSLPPATPYEGETALMRRIRLFVQRRWRCRLFRNNVGLAWTGKAIVGAIGVLIKRPYQIRFGLAVGSSDVVGISSILITPAMVGTRVGVFTALEIKGPSGHLTDAQKNFLAMVIDMGGRAAAVRSIEETISFMEGVEEITQP